MTGTDDIDRDRNYRIGYATELIRQIVAHHTRGDETALSHSIDVARRFITEEQDRRRSPVLFITEEQDQ